MIFIYFLKKQKKNERMKIHVTKQNLGCYRRFKANAISVVFTNKFTAKARVNKNKKKERRKKKMMKQEKKEKEKKKEAVFFSSFHLLSSSSTSCPSLRSAAPQVTTPPSPPASFPEASPPSLVSSHSAPRPYFCPL